MQRIVLTLLFALHLLFTFASESNWIKLNMNPLYNLPWSGEAQGNGTLTADEFIDWYTKTYFPDVDVVFEKVACKEDAIGMTHCRFRQMAFGYAVSHGILIAHVKDGMVQSFNGEIYPVENSTFEFPDYRTARNSFLDKYPQNRERSFPDEDHYSEPVYSIGSETERALLCYRFRTAKTDGTADDIFFFEPYSNRVIRMEPQLIHSDSAGTASTFFRGRQNIVADFLGANRFRLKETKRPLNTYDGALGKYLTDTDNVWDTKGKEIAGDVHWGMGRLHDFMKQKFNWDSYANRKDSMTAVLNFSGSGNAFWNLSGNYATFLVNGTAAVKPCAALDVVGHEFGHGIADENAGMVYSGETCMLHESFADITGTLLERYVDSTKSNWLLGDEVWSGGIRNIQNPKAFKHPMTYKGIGWGGGCHSNGGVQNYWFYLMAMGDTGTNDNSHNYAIQGLGLEKATQIMFRAIFHYATPNTTYPEMASHTLKACKDLYGSCGPELKMTWDAWKAVGIEDTTVQLIDLSHGVIAPALKCTSLPTDVHYRSKGDRSRKVWWDFGGMDTSNASDVRKTYTQYGSYRVFLMTEVCNQRFFDTLVVQINHQPEAAFDVNKAAFCMNNGDSILAVSKTQNPDTKQNLENKWLLSPYQIERNGKQFRESLDGKPYNFTLSLTSYYKSGCSSTSTQDFEIHPVPKAAFKVNSTCMGLNIPLKNETDTIRPLSFMWTIGEGGTAMNYTDYEPVLKAATVGRFPVKLEILDDITNCGSVATDTFSVYANPLPSFGVSNNCLGDTMLFRNTTSHSIGLNWFQWNFGLYRPFNKEEVALPVRSNEPWIVSLEVLDKNGCKGKIFDTIPILFIKSDFELPLYCLNDPKPFLNKSEGSNLSYVWDFGDGSTSTEENPNHMYADSGLYQVKLTTSSPECSVYQIRTLEVLKNPQAAFEVNGTCDGDTTQFIQNSELHGQEAGFYWLFGDGDSSLMENPEHVYQIDQSTTYQVQLLVEAGNGCSDRTSRAVTVNSLPHCGFSWEYTYPERQVRFNADSMEYREYSWDFGDGNGSSGSNPVHKYADDGNYRVKLSVADENGCNCEFERVVRGINVGIGEIAGELPVIYPNPGNGILSLKGNIDAYQTGGILDMTGRELMRIHELGRTIDAGHLPAGMYYLKLTGTGGELRFPFVIGSGY